MDARVGYRRSMMKRVRCPHCKDTVEVQAKVEAAVSQVRHAPAFLWIAMVCGRCQKSFEYDGDPRSTTTRPATP